MHRKGLQCAADALDDLAEGRMPAPACLAVAAAALDAECVSHPRWRDLADARARLRALADGGEVPLDAVARERAADLADVVKSLLDTI